EDPPSLKLWRDKSEVGVKVIFEGGGSAVAQAMAGQVRGGGERNPSFDMALDIVTDHLAGNIQYQHIITEDQKLFTIEGYTRLRPFD
ncbi:MAG: hypothetical protein P1S46_12245, partial [bacterium]|nr:hypothetical protein [bacterium]